VVAPNNVDTDLVNGQALLGCRVPTLIVSPFARGTPAQPRLSSLLYDHTSVLKLIEWRWNLAPLTARDASDEVANLAYALDFTAPDTSVPELPVIAEPATVSCTLDDILDSGGTGLPLINASKATELAKAKSASGVGDESYDFYLLMQSERVKGWTIPNS
jgi:phospholipase C